MSEILNVVPILILFAVGYFLKRGKLAPSNAADSLLAVVFYVGLPALILKSLTAMSFHGSLWIFPLAALACVAASLPLGYVITRHSSLTRKETGTFMTSIAIINVGFMIPFVQAFYGAQGIARLVMFDVMQGILAYTVGFAIASGYNPSHKGGRARVRSAVLSPPLWAVALSLTLNLCGWHITDLPWVNTGLKSIAGMVAPLVVLALGMRFNPQVLRLKTSILAVLVRSGVGLVVGLCLALAFHLTGLDRAVLVLLCSAPVGFMALTYANVEQLDEDLAASITSLSVVLGILTSVVLITIY